MEERNSHTLHVDLIRTELNRILDEWLRLHLRLTAILIAIALAVEIVWRFLSRSPRSLRRPSACML